MNRVDKATATKLLNLMYQCRATYYEVCAALGKSDEEWQAARAADEEARAAYIDFVRSLEVAS